MSNAATWPWVVSVKFLDVVGVCGYYGGWLLVREVHPGRTALPLNLLLTAGKSEVQGIGWTWIGIQACMHQCSVACISRLFAWLGDIMSSLDDWWRCSKTACHSGDD